MLEPVTKTVTSSAGCRVRVTSSVGCRVRSCAKTENFAEERSPREVGKLAVWRPFFSPKASGDTAVTNGDKLGRMDLGCFFGPKTEIERSVRLDFVFGQKRANRDAEAPYLPSDSKKRAFREFGKLAVLGTFSAQKGAVT